MQYEKELEKLNTYQKEAVLDESDACLVNANVGSGKTTVLISKVMYLHNEKQIPYEEMVVLTFTNKAADEIKERLINLDDKVTVADLPWFGTFHGVCLNLLKKVLPVEQLGYTKEFMVMPPEEEVEMAEQLILEHQLKIKYKNRLKKRLEQAMAIRDESKKISRYQDDIFLLTELLTRRKHAEDKMTYLDLLENARILLEQEKDKKESLFEPQWIIIDEVQDCDGEQLALLDAMKKLETRLFAVGDPNQVIYSWRGSALNVFYTLKSRYQARELNLPINYRSSGSILEAARFFLQNGSRLEGIRESGSKIVIKNHYNPFQEADYLADRIKELHSQGLAYREIAIFYRLQNQSKIFEDVFTREGIPYEVSLKKNVQDIPVLNWFLKVLRFAVHPAEISSGVAALCNKDYGVAISEKEAIQWIKHPETGRFELFDRMTGFEAAYRKGMKVTEFLSYFQVEQYLRPTSVTFVEDMDALERLIKIMEQEDITEGGDLCGGLRRFLNNSMLYGMNVYEEKIHTDADSVKLMTLHASKGLEFSCVFITGVNYGLIPLQSKGMEEEEEERRLFFVGITRAKDQLELSYYTSPEQYRATPGPSRYLSMIPKQLVSDESIQNGPKMDTNARLQEIKRQILMSRGEMQYLFPEQEKKEETVKEEKKADCRVKHAKYGKGMIVNETEDTITVDFEDYGEKEFLKMFAELEKY